MSLTSIKDLESSIIALLDTTEKTAETLENTFENIYFDALKEHTNLTRNQIHRKWLQYNATHLRFK